MIDIHAHIVPGLDDGVRTLEEARGLAELAAAEGVTVIVATPHVRGDFPTTPRQMEAGVDAVRAELAAAGVAVDVLTGGEIDLVRLPQLGPDDLRRFSIAGGGRYVLLEFPYRGWPMALESALERLRAHGMRAVIAHPERNRAVQDRPEALAGAVAAGALVQVTAASLDGRLGRSPAAAARKLLRLGLVHVLASDAHAPDVRQCGLKAAADTLGDPGLAHFLTVEAPSAIVAGEEVAAPPPARRRRLLR